MSVIIAIRSFATRFEAEMAQSMLSSHGIKSIVEGDDCGGVRPDIAFTSGGFELKVSVMDVDRANQLLSE